MSVEEAVFPSSERQFCQTSYDGGNFFSGNVEDITDEDFEPPFEYDGQNNALAEEQNANTRRSRATRPQMRRNETSCMGAHVVKRSGAQLLKEKKRHTAATLRWLQENYCHCNGVCLPRENVYEHYVQFCKKEKLDPACKATFGKVIKQTFPGVTSKRLGARGHSKYHYCGIAVKENSEYYNAPEYSGKGLTRFSGCKMKSEGGFTRKYSLSSRTGTLLPEFPKSSSLKIPEAISPPKVQIFLTMYKTHCQCILDSAIGGNFEEIRTFLLHFWQGLPEHLLPLVRHQMINDVISICDWILYKTLNDVFIPATMQEMSEKLLCDIHNLADNWEHWMTSSLENLPECLAAAKLPVARLFVRTLKRHVTFIHLAQTVRPVLYDAHLVKTMLEDLERVNLDATTRFRHHTVCSGINDDDTDLLFDSKFFNEFHEQLRKQAMVEGLIEWIDEVVQRKIIKPSEEDGKSLRKRAGDFLLKWHFFGTRIENNLTVGNAPSFTSFHLIHLLLNEYLRLTIESQFLKDKEAELEMVLRRYLKDTERDTLKRLSSPPSSCFLVNRHQRGDQHLTPLQQSGSPHQLISNKERKRLSSTPQRWCDKLNHTNGQNTASGSGEIKISTLSTLGTNNSSILTPPLSPGSNCAALYADCIHQTPNGYNVSNNGGYNYTSTTWNSSKDQGFSTHVGANDQSSTWRPHDQIQQQAGPTNSIQQVSEYMPTVNRGVNHQRVMGNEVANETVGSNSYLVNGPISLPRNSGVHFETMANTSRNYGHYQCSLTSKQPNFTTHSTSTNNMQNDGQYYGDNCDYNSMYSSLGMITTNGQDHLTTNTQALDREVYPTPASYQVNYMCPTLTQPDFNIIGSDFIQST